MEEVINIRRPKFLTILCVLSFSGGCVALFDSIGMYSFIRSIAAGIVDTDNIRVAGNSGKLDVAPSSLYASASLINNGAIAILIIGITGAILSLWGAMKMWKLNKNGFFIYLIGQMLPLLTLLILILSLNDFASADINVSAMGFYAGIVVYYIVSQFIAIIFIILFAFNLKHMKHI